MYQIGYQWELVKHSSHLVIEPLLTSPQWGEVNIIDKFIIYVCSDKNTSKLIKSHFEPWIYFVYNRIIIDYVLNQHLKLRITTLQVQFYYLLRSKTGFKYHGAVKVPPFLYIYIL